MMFTEFNIVLNLPKYILTHGSFWFEKCDGMHSIENLFIQLAKITKKKKERKKILQFLKVPNNLSFNFQKSTCHFWRRL